MTRNGIWVRGRVDDLHSRRRVLRFCLLSVIASLLLSAAALCLVACTSLEQGAVAYPTATSVAMPSSAARPTVMFLGGPPCGSTANCAPGTPPDDAPWPDPTPFTTTVTVIKTITSTTAVTSVSTDTSTTTIVPPIAITITVTDGDRSVVQIPKPDWELAAKIALSLTMTASAAVTARFIGKFIAEWRIHKSFLSSFHVLFKHKLQMAVQIFLVFLGLPAFVALGVMNHWSIDRGGVGPWIAALAATLIAIAAVALASYSYERQHSKDTVERSKADERARRRANLVKVEVRQSQSTDQTKRFIDIRVANNGSTDLYDVTWFPPLIQYSSSGNAEPVQCAIVGEQPPFKSRVVETLTRGWSRTTHLEFPVPEVGGTPQPDEPDVMPLVSFIDVDEYRLGYVDRRTDKSDARIQQGWDIVGTDYPKRVSGLLRKFVRKVKE